MKKTKMITISFTCTETFKKVLDQAVEIGGGTRSSFIQQSLLEPAMKIIRDYKEVTDE